MDEENSTKSVAEYLAKKNKEMVKDTAKLITEPVNNMVSSLGGFLDPKSFVKNFGVLIGSPAIMMLGNKVEDISKGIGEQISAQKKATRDNFLLESQKDKEMSLRERNVELLEDILDKDTGAAAGKEEEKPGFLKSLLGSILGGVGLGGGIGLGGKLSGGLLKIKGISGVLIKVLGRYVALPILAALAAFDFVKGFKNAFEITGKTDIVSKIRAGMSTALSAFTLGFISPKKIYEFENMVIDGLVKWFTHPIQFLRDISGPLLNGVDWINDALNLLTFDLIPKGILKKGVLFIKDKIIDLFIAPLIELKNYITETDLYNYVVGTVSPIFNTIENSISTGMSALKDFFFNMPISFKENIIDPLMLVKNSIMNGSLFEPLTNYFKNFDFMESFGVNNLIVEMDAFKDKMINPLIMVKDKIISGDIFEPLTNYFKNFDLMEFLNVESLIGEIKSFKENIIGIISNPKEFFKSLFNDDKIIPVKKDEGGRETTSDIMRKTAINDKKYKESLKIENNNQTIINSNTSNNIATDDMSVATDDMDYRQLNLNLLF